MWKQFFYVYKIIYISPLQYRTNLLIPFVDMRIERKRKKDWHYICVFNVLCFAETHNKKFETRPASFGGFQMLSPHVRLFVCFVSVHIYLTCSYCLSLYANQVKWYSVFSFITAFNFTLHFKWSLNPVQRISL